MSKRLDMFRFNLASKSNLNICWTNDQDRLIISEGES